MLYFRDKVKPLNIADDWAADLPLKIF